MIRNPGGSTGAGTCTFSKQIILWQVMQLKWTCSSVWVVSGQLCLHTAKRVIPSLSIILCTSPASSKSLSARYKVILSTLLKVDSSSVWEYAK